MNRLQSEAIAGFGVYQYSIETLKQILASNHESSSQIIEEKLHSLYFKNYFAHPDINAQTVVVENEYVDRDFLEDFAAYYVRCFRTYKRKCLRLHFFKTCFQQSDFESLLSGNQTSLSQSLLQENYLGFIVVKPLPQTIIGRTCLVTYGSDNGRRLYPIGRDYDVNLFGISLKVRNTLAFQEQDSVVAACATSALWSVFQGTGKLFQHHIPSPVEITKAASVSLSEEPSHTRVLPNHGLNIVQMMAAIRDVGLESHIVRVGTLIPEAEKPLKWLSLIPALKSNIYAYLSAGIPIITAIALIDVKTPQKPVRLGLHAVAIAGFSIANTPSTLEGATGLRLQSSKINKLYVHDDQVGPFSRMIIESDSFGTSWGFHNGGNDSTVKAVPLSLLVPLYNKIRIPFETIQETIVQFNTFVEKLRMMSIYPLQEPLEWDIRLTNSNDLKEQLFTDKVLESGYRKYLLLESMPRFIWRATARYQDECWMDFLFDATDIEQGKFFVRAIEYNNAFAEFLRRLSQQRELLEPFFDGQTLERNPAWRIFEWFASPPVGTEEPENV